MQTVAPLNSAKDALGLMCYVDTLNLPIVTINQQPACHAAFRGTVSHPQDHFLCSDLLTQFTIHAYK